MRDAGSGFNPHTHAGCDLIEVIQPRPLCVSIHTPTQGVTSSSCHHKQHENSFNPHTHAGCDKNERDGTVLLKSFNPHTHAGCD